MRKMDLDYIKVDKDASGVSFSIIPDSNLRRMVYSKEPKEEYDKIPDRVKDLVMLGKTIPLSRSNCHLIDGELYVREQ